MPTINQFGVIGTGILHPQHKNKWRLQFDGLGNGAPGGGRDMDSQPLTVQAITVDRPKLEFEKITLDRYNSRSYVAGKYTWQTVTATFESDLGATAVRKLREQLQNQQHIIGNEPGDQGTGAYEAMNTAPTASFYKFATNILMLDGSNHETPMEEWVLSGCYLEQVDYGDLDYAASEVVKVVCTISFDHAQQCFGPTLDTSVKDATFGQGSCSV